MEGLTGAPCVAQGSDRLLCKTVIHPRGSVIVMMEILTISASGILSGSPASRVVVDRSRSRSDESARTKNHLEIHILHRKTHDAPKVFCQEQQARVAQVLVFLRV